MERGDVYMLGKVPARQNWDGVTCKCFKVVGDLLCKTKRALTL